MLENISLYPSFLLAEEVAIAVIPSSASILWITRPKKLYSFRRCHFCWSLKIYIKASKFCFFQ